MSILCGSVGEKGTSTGGLAYISERERERE